MEFEFNVGKLEPFNIGDGGTYILLPLILCMYYNLILVLIVCGDNIIDVDITMNVTSENCKSGLTNFKIDGYSVSATLKVTSGNDDDDRDDARNRRQNTCYTSYKW